MLHCVFAILCYATSGANPSTVTCPPAQLRRRLLGSDSCPDNGMLPSYVRFPQNVGASSRAIPVLTMGSMLPWYVRFPLNVGVSLRAIPVLTMASSAPWLPLLPKSEAAAASVGISPVFSFIWLATLQTAPWRPPRPPAWLGERNSTDSGKRPYRQRSFERLPRRRQKQRRRRWRRGMPRAAITGLGGDHPGPRG